MSVRSNASANKEVKQFRDAVEQAKQANEITAFDAGCEPTADAAADEAAISAREFEALTPVEQAAASLGVHPASWKPIGFMNAAHYDNLIKANALDESLSRRIEASRAIQ